MFRKSSGRGQGFSLIETLAAITIFAIVTLGITPLIVSSIRGTSLARSHTVAKNIVGEAMERVRGLPYFDAAVNRDVLDLYFPNLGAGYDSAAKTFTTVCTSTSAAPIANGARACPARHADGTARIPSGYDVTFVVRFVVPSGSNPETFSTVTPLNTYNSANEATALPPSQLIEIKITATWTELGKSRQFSLISLVGERRLSPNKATANAAVDHVFSVTTAYLDSAGKVSGMAGTGGSVSSDVEIKAIVSASLEANAGRFSLSSKQTATEPGAQLASASGAQSSLRAPLNAVPAPMVAKGPSTINHPALIGESIGFIGDTAVNMPASGLIPTPAVQVVNGFPRSTSNVATTGGVGDLYWADNQADTDELLSPKKFDPSPTRYMFSVQRPSGSERLKADTYAEATPESPLSGRKVQATARASAPRFVLMPVTFATPPGGVIVIDSFTANVDCKATGSSSSAVATGSWSATLSYWRDDDPGDLLAVGRYQSLSLGGNVSTTVTSDPLAPLRTENPLVYDSTEASGDVYLFNDPAANKLGYLDSWSSTFAMGSSKSAATSSVSMPYAINIVTAKTNSANEESKFTLSIGKLSCRAVDNRA